MNSATLFERMMNDLQEQPWLAKELFLLCIKDRNDVTWQTTVIFKTSAGRSIMIEKMKHEVGVSFYNYHDITDPEKKQSIPLGWAEVNWHQFKMRKDYERRIAAS